MPTPGTIFVIVVIALVCVGTLGMVLLRVAAWLAYRRASVNHYDYTMSSVDEQDDEEEDDATLPATNAATQQQQIATPAIDSNALLFRERTRIAADLVRGGVCGETKALQIAFQVRPSSTNPRYQEARAALKVALNPAVETPLAHRPTAAQFASDKRV